MGGWVGGWVGGAQAAGAGGHRAHVPVWLLPVPPPLLLRSPLTTPGPLLTSAGLTDALSKSVEQLEGAQQALLLLPMESRMWDLQQQALVLQKLVAMREGWQGTHFGYSITLPFLGSISVSITVMASVAAATTLRCLHRIVKGGWLGGLHVLGATSWAAMHYSGRLVE